MEVQLGHWFEFLLNRWQTATMFDYGAASALIILSGWLVSRTTSR
jgi:hypothetical protein